MIDEVEQPPQDNVENVQPVQAPSSQERMFTQRDMSEVAKREREKAYEKGKQAALEDFEKQRAMGFQANPIAQNQSSGITQEQIEHMIAQKAPELLHQKLQEMEQNARINQTVESFANKIASSKERYPELENQLNDLDFHSFAPVVAMVNDMENTADIMHDLLSSPMKMGNLMSLMQNQPKLAAKAIYELSNSIKQNQQAAAENRTAREPYDQLRSSTQKNVDSSNLSVSDFRKMFRN